MPGSHMARNTIHPNGERNADFKTIRAGRKNPTSGKPTWIASAAWRSGGWEFRRLFEVFSNLQNSEPPSSESKGRCCNCPSYLSDTEYTECAEKPFRVFRGFEIPQQEFRMKDSLKYRTPSDRSRSFGAFGSSGLSGFSDSVGVGSDTFIVPDINNTRICSRLRRSREVSSVGTNKSVCS